MKNDKSNINLNSTKIKTPRDRSASYPAVNLGEAIMLVGKIKHALASAPFNRDTGSKAMGYVGATGASTPRIAALVHFSLLQRAGDVYKLSSLADRIIIPKSEADKKKAIIEAIKAPKLYGDLIESFKSQALPALLSNILVHDHKISEKVSKQVAADFISSAEFAGVLVNGIITDESFSVEESNIQEENIEGEKISDVDKKDTKKNTSKNILYEAPPLPSGLVISFPDNLKTSFVLGDFSAEIKNLETKAQTILKKQDSSKETIYRGVEP